MPPDLSRRLVAAELMDTEPQSVASLEGAVRFLALANRWFGGYRPLLRRFDAWSQRWNAQRVVRILDVGTGGADVPLAVVRWARRRGFQVRVTGVEVVPGIAELARARTAGIPEISVEIGDIFSLLGRPPAGAADDRVPARFDYVTACLFLHHVHPGDAVRVVRAMAAGAARGVVISDLRRSHAAYVAVGLLSRAFGNALVRHDAPLSVRRAFTRDELHAMARQAGLPWLNAADERWFRVSLAGEYPDAA